MRSGSMVATFHSIAGVERCPGDHERSHAHVVAESVHARSGGDFHGDDFVADRHADGAGDFHVRKDCARDSATQRRKGKTGDLVTARWLDQGYGDVLRRLKHCKKFSFGHANSAVKTPVTLLYRRAFNTAQESPG
jgi:hypothetical protein